MNPYIVFIKEINGNQISLTREDLEDIIKHIHKDAYNEGYNKGYKDGMDCKFTYYNYPTNITPVPSTPTITITTDTPKYGDEYATITCEAHNAKGD